MKTQNIFHSGHFFWVFVAALFLSFCPPATGQIITTAAGMGTAGYTGDGGLATAAEMSENEGVAVDSLNNFYVVDSGNNVVRKVTIATGIITTIAGTGIAGYTGDGGAATSATLRDPSSAMVDPLGNIIVCDSLNNVVRKITVATGVITTVAGTGICGHTGDGGPATSARMCNPDGIAMDAGGNLYVSEISNNDVRKINAATGIITTFVGTTVSGFSGDGGPAASAQLAAPEALAFNLQGNLLICDGRNYRIREVTMATGIISTFAGSGTLGFSGDGGPALAAEFDYPGGIAVDCSDDVFIADEDNLRVRMVSAVTGNISTVAGSGGTGYTGDGGIATSATFRHLEDIALDQLGNLYISDQPNNVTRKVISITSACATTPTSTPTTTPTPTVTASPTKTTTPTVSSTVTITPTPTATPIPPCQSGFSISLNLYNLQTAPQAPLTINATLCYPGNCTVEIYNSAGEHIRTLANIPNQTAETFQVTWDGKNKYGAQVASGTYIIRFVEPFGAHQARVLVVR